MEKTFLVMHSSPVVLAEAHERRRKPVGMCMSSHRCQLSGSGTVVVVVIAIDPYGEYEYDNDNGWLLLEPGA